VSAPAPSRSFCGLRHGATNWNRQGLFQGRTDNPLNADGLAQAHDAASLLREAGITRIVSSPLVRALKTAEIIAAAVSAPLTIDEGIIECDFGSLEGRSIAEVMKEHGITAMEDLATRSTSCSILGRSTVTLRVDGTSSSGRSCITPPAAGPFVRN